MAAGGIGWSGSWERTRPARCGGPTTSTFASMWRSSASLLPADADRAEVLARTAQQARTAARLREHPHVVAVYDTFTEDDVPWTVMQLVDGRSLREHLAVHGRLSVDRAADVARAVLKALAAAYTADVVHRNITPAAVILARRRRGPADRLRGRGADGRRRADRLRRSRRHAWIRRAGKAGRSRGGRGRRPLLAGCDAVRGTRRRTALRPRRRDLGAPRRGPGTPELRPARPADHPAAAEGPGTAPDRRPGAGPARHTARHGSAGRAGMAGGRPDVGRGPARGAHRPDQRPGFQRRRLTARQRR